MFINVYDAWLNDEPLMQSKPVCTDGQSLFVKYDGKIVCLATRIAFNNKPDEFVVNIAKFDVERIKKVQQKVIEVLRTTPETTFAVKRYVDMCDAVSFTDLI